jgi:S-ribosylhomocysteine lyase
MIKVEDLGWETRTVGELDHRLLTAPHVKLRSYTVGQKGDVVFCVDLRFKRPNTDYLSITELHSLEHFLLEGFRKYLPDNFLSIGIMGCQTGFYLVLLNEGNAQKICSVYETILRDILDAKNVPYTSIQECGNYQNHDLGLAQYIAEALLDARSNWLKVV